MTAECGEAYESKLNDGKEAANCSSKQDLDRVRVQPFNRKPVSHVIFDLDGLLMKTETIYEEADRRMTARYGVPLKKEIRMKTLGSSEKQAASIIVSEHNLPISPEQYEKEVNELLDDMLRGAALMDGAERLIRHLHKHGVSMAVATSSSERSVRVKTSHYESLFNLFHHFVMASSDPEVEHGKPAPDVFLTCIKRFPDKPDPEKCLVFEDSPNGVAAALRANMQVIMVPEDHINEEDQRKATLTLNSLLEFKPELFGLPPFPS